MTKIIIKKRGENIRELEISGHTDYAVEGEDIVCAGLSCIAQTAVLGLLYIAKVNAHITRKNEEGYLKIILPTDMNKDQILRCNTILQTAVLGLSDLRDGYSDFIELEVIEDVY